MIDIRIMWFEKREEREAKKIVERIIRLLNRMGYDVVKPPREFPNRTSGGRIYFKVSKKR